MTEREKQLDREIIERFGTLTDKQKKKIIFAVHFLLEKGELPSSLC
jgi:hypothetical protein